jgi:hypothetical protein
MNRRPEMATAIKIPRDVFLSKLESKLVESDKNEKLNEVAAKAHEKVVAKWQQDVVKFLGKNPSLVTRVYGSYRNTLTVEVDNSNERFPACPSPDTLPTLSGWERNELLQTIAIVKLSDAEFVPASITKNASRFLV